MAMIMCAECAGTVSSEAKSCPGCGADRKVFQRSTKTKEPASSRKKLVIGGAVFVGVCAIGLRASFPGESATPTPEDPATRQEHARIHFAYGAAQALKASLRNPDTLTFRSITTNDDGSVVCMSYRAQNGFGGMNVDHVVYKDGDPSQGAAAWNRNCAHKTTYDLTTVGELIK